MQVVGTLETLGKKTRQPPVPLPALVQQVSAGREELVLGVLGTAAQPGEPVDNNKLPVPLSEEEDQISSTDSLRNQRLRTPVCLPRPVAGCFCKTETLHD